MSVGQHVDHVCTGGRREPSKLARVWDKDFNLVQTFTDGESYERLDLDGPAFRAVWEHMQEFPRAAMHLTVDENGERTSYRLKAVEVVREDDGAKAMTLEWGLDGPDRFVYYPSTTARI